MAPHEMDSQFDTMRMDPMRNSQLSLALLALVVIGAAAAQAQTNTGSITATATVQTPINVVGAQGLNFTSVFPGVNKTVAATDLVNAGRFDVTGQNSATVNLSFTLPTTLAAGANTMPIAGFTGIHALLSTQAGGVAFTPSAGTSTALSGTGLLYVWLGAQVQPATNQAAGVYTGTVTMTVVY
jgi:spore coat protein U-like protein